VYSFKLARRRKGDNTEEEIEEENERERSDAKNLL
jgi:hypothetical protein